MAWRAATPPQPGWKGRSRTQLKNPRPPAVPATLDITLGEYFAAAATMGLLASQAEEPDREWAQEWSLDYGYEMAKRARRRRKVKGGQ